MQIKNRNLQPSLFLLIFRAIDVSTLHKENCIDLYKGKLSETPMTTL